MSDTLKDLLGAATDRSVRYLHSLETRQVAPSKAGVAGLSRFDVPLQDEPIDGTRVLAELDEIGSPPTMAMAGPRFFGFVIGGSLPAALAANWFASAWDQNTGLYISTPATSALEQVALKWL